MLDLRTQNSELSSQNDIRILTPLFTYGIKKKKICYTRHVVR